MTQTEPLTGTDEEIKTRLRAEFPAWSIIRTDRGRWWANRGPLQGELLNERSSVDADTPGELRIELQAIEASQ
ncbi:hypothetical protein F8568_017670 [Actinomadura sp. LD22]|uniref:Uncharacterized protein n=1 Tax=Actinomadura physcomitrii TaxID=2650748 RepID=A0A6I4MB28_9ACTN|nr:hypothetical protein [Actinomadura physcomitrii]MWA02170.1 hypothetical protein [Actinomadura physcomitrii]